MHASHANSPRMNAVAPMYVCPMHSEVRKDSAGPCPHCGMPLIEEGKRFGLLRHMMSNPLHVVFMAVVMLVLMAALMMMMR